MLDKKEMTALVPSVGADERQSSQKVCKNSIPASDKEINENVRVASNPLHLHTVSMTELYQTTYASRPPIIDGLAVRGRVHSRRRAENRKVISGCAARLSCQRRQQALELYNEKNNHVAAGYSPLLAAMRNLDRLDACRHCISKQEPIALAYPHMLIQRKQRQALASFVGGNHIFFIKENIPRRFLCIWVNGRHLQHSIVLNLHDGQHIALSAAHADISFADFDGARSERF